MIDRLYKHVEISFIPWTHFSRVAAYTADGADTDTQPRSKYIYTTRTQSPHRHSTILPPHFNLGSGVVPSPAVEGHPPGRSYGMDLDYFWSLVKFYIRRPLLSATYSWRNKETARFFRNFRLYSYWLIQIYANIHIPTMAPFIRVRSHREFVVTSTESFYCGLRSITTVHRSQKLAIVKNYWMKEDLENLKRDIRGPSISTATLQIWISQKRGNMVISFFPLTKKEPTVLHSWDSSSSYYLSAIEAMGFY